MGRLMCETREIFDFAAHHPMREMRKLALAETVTYIRENMSTAMGAYSETAIPGHRTQARKH